MVETEIVERGMMPAIVVAVIKVNAVVVVVLITIKEMVVEAH